MSLHTPGNALQKASLEEEQASSSSFASARDSGRLRGLIATYHSMVWRTVRNLGVLDGDIDDAVQQVFIIASNKLESIDEGRERSFLAGVAVRIASRSRRTRERRREAVDVEPPEQPASWACPVEELDRIEARRLFEDLLDTMSPELRLVFVMYEVEELTLAEIAVALELAPGTVASRVRRARQLFVARARRLQGKRMRDGGRR
jgi:RNA polymerase sigma-70 factor (ECF subfamily)